jgi:hypothetical protein
MRFLKGLLLASVWLCMPALAAVERKTTSSYEYYKRVLEQPGASKKTIEVRWRPSKQAWDSWLKKVTVCDNKSTSTKLGKYSLLERAARLSNDFKTKLEFYQKLYGNALHDAAVVKPPLPYALVDSSLSIAEGRKPFLWYLFSLSEHQDDPACHEQLFKISYHTWHGQDNTGCLLPSKLLRIETLGQAPFIRCYVGITDNQLGDIVNSAAYLVTQDRTYGFPRLYIPPDLFKIPPHVAPSPLLRFRLRGRESDYFLLDPAQKAEYLTRYKKRLMESVLQPRKGMLQLYTLLAAL